eukprot:SAG22_NODE_576_length_8982_cov_21.167736_3_plen_74_part_00
MITAFPSVSLPFLAVPLLIAAVSPGRAQEVPGEDPYLTGEYGAAIIRATQQGLDSSSRYWQAAGTMKHFQLCE